MTRLICKLKPLGYSSPETQSVGTRLIFSSIFQAASSEVMAIRASRCYDPSTKSIVLANGIPLTMANMKQTGLPPEFTELLFKLCHDLVDLQSDNAEYALFTSICIFSGKLKTFLHRNSIFNYMFGAGSLMMAQRPKCAYCPYCQLYPIKNGVNIFVEVAFHVRLLLTFGVWRSSKFSMFKID